MECVVALFVGERGRDGGGLIVVERSRVVGRFIGIYIYFFFAGMMKLGSNLLNHYCARKIDGL